MTESHAAPILLVRALEETLPDVFPADVRQQAAEYAGDPVDETKWFIKRAEFLLNHTPAAYQTILQLSEIPFRWNLIVGGCACVLGLFSHYLNPTGKIHALFNSMLLLVAWNLLIYVLLALEWLYRRRRVAQNPHSGREKFPAPSAQFPFPSSPVSPAPADSFLARNLRRIFPILWTFLHWVTARYETTRGLSRIAVKFWSLWLEAARPLASVRLRRMLHCGAIGLAIGAVIGSYVRGLFFEYNVVWRSTFIRDETSVDLLLKLALLPATTLLGWPQEHWANVSQLMTPDGAPAAAWIHLYAATVVVYILAPRLALIAWEAARSRRYARRVRLNFHEQYYTDRLQPVREAHERRLTQTVREAVGRESARFAEKIAAFVCAQLYDERLTPILFAFQKNGGSVSTLEERIKAACEAFAPKIEARVAAEQKVFEQTLAVTLRDILGRNVPGQFGLSDGLLRAADHSPTSASSGLTNTFGYEFTDGIGMVVSATVAMVGGVVSGGFGHTVGIAIITSLLGTTGPVGFLIGALAGLIVAGAGWWLGRDAVHDVVKQIELPGAVTNWVLWASGFEEIIAAGRKRCYTAVKESIDGTFQPLVPQIVEQIQEQVRPSFQARASAR